jgi:Micrococcal nuclease (thermonuclease) homologs
MIKFLIFSLLFLASPVYAQIHALDGKTVLLGKEEIRLTGYDTPVDDDASCELAIVLSHDARQFLQTLLDDPSKRKDFRREERKEKGRILARLFINGRDVADIMIEKELAIAFDCPDGRCPQRMNWCEELDGSE